MRVESEAYVNGILSRMRSALPSASIYDKGRTTKIIRSNNQGITTGVMEIPFNSKTLAKEVEDRVTINFQYISGNYSRDCYVFPDGFNTSMVASLECMLSYARDILHESFSGVLRLVKFKGARKYYVSMVQIVLQGVPKLELSDKGISTLFTVTKRLADEVEKAIGQFDKLHIEFPLDEGVHIQLYIKQGNSNITAWKGLYANSLKNYADSALRGINLEAVYNTFVKTGIPVYTIDYFKGTTGEVKHLGKVQNHFLIQFI